ncbi:winged helix-turn-helix transcriptional regulator [Streptomyces sp. NBC_00299]|uniref:winged helix-turn-helix transcriptional regulator n=1 Tax=Streptomyces sp. NBC_00299 TaxID=2975705 RepID=UPI002E2DDDC0|nr:helix-turn-helix domain-containing protein [Streptomyces sp. NBC_00299]
MGIGRRPGAYVCGIDAAMDVVGGKWKVLILWALHVRPYRFGELRRELPGVTEKVLAAQLRELEADGIVHREAYDEVPPRVEYSLTPLGVSLNEALGPLGVWGRVNILGGAGEPGGEPAGETADEAHGSATPDSAAAGEMREHDDVALIPGRP